MREVMAMFGVVKRRLSEPSTWAGLSVLSMLLGVQGVDDETLQALQGLAFAFGGGAAAAAIGIPERKKGSGAE